MLNFIVNPFSGGKEGKKTRKNLAEISNYLSEKNIDYNFYFTERKGHAIEITRDLIKNGATNIVAIGGDGSLHEVLNGFDNFENCAFGIIPSGTGNDFATAMGLPTNAIEALKIILETKPKYTDFIQLPNVRCLNISGVGMDVEVLKLYEQLKKKTKFGYTKCLIKTLFKFKPINFNAYFDGDKQNFTSYIACIANGTMFGGGLKICSIAKQDDGLLDFVAIGNMNKLSLINAFIKLKKGSLLKHKKIIHKTAKEITIESDLPLCVNLDGELYENIPFSAKVVHNTLKMFRP